MGKQRVLTASEGRLFRLLKAALDQIQDDQAQLIELITGGNSDPKRTKMLLKNLEATSTHIRDDLRRMGLTLKKREPFDDDTPTWELLLAPSPMRDG